MSQSSESASQSPSPETDVLPAETSPETSAVLPMDLTHQSLSENLKSLVDPNNPQDLSLRRVLDAIEEKSFGLLLLILSLPSALPVPAPGYSTPFGIVLSILAIQMMKGHTKPVIPDKFKKISIGHKLAKRMIDAACKVLGLTERFIKPRFLWVGSRNGQRALGIVVLTMACLMILPIPYTNTFPAMVIFMLGVGLIEDDGLVCGAGFIIGIFSILLYIGIIVGLIYLFNEHGWEILENGKEAIKALFTGQEIPPTDATEPAQ